MAFRNVISNWGGNLLAQESDWKVVFEKEGVVFKGSFFVDRAYGMLVGDDGAIWKTTDAGETWEDLSQPSFGDLIHIDITLQKDFIFICDTNTVWRSTDEGETWDMVFDREDVKINDVTKNYQGGGKMVHLSCDDGKLFNSMSDGDKWYLQDGKSLIKSGERILFSNLGDFESFLPDTIFAFGTESVHWAQTDDDFGSFYSLTSRYLEGTEIRKFRRPNDYSEAYYNVDRIYIGVNNEVAYAPRGGGEITLYDASDLVINDACYIRYLGGFNSNWFGFAVGENGYIGRSKGNFQTPFSQEEKLTDRNLYVLDIGSHQVEDQGHSHAYMSLFAAGDGVVLRKTMNWTPTKVDKLPQEASVSAYPNPFDDQINISTKGFAQGEQVSVNIYNAQGQLVSQLYNGQVQESELQLQSNFKGQSGIYFVEVTSNTKRAVVRLVKN